MGRKTQITKEMMLNSAYEILEEEGYSGVNIKSIAARVGCSTQPVSWHFGNMEGLRRELYSFAKAKIWENASVDRNGNRKENSTGQLNGNAGLDSFFEIGKLYISTACDKPNVFRFLMVDDLGDIDIGENDILSQLLNSRMGEMLSSSLKVDRQALNAATRNIIIYTHGLATLMMWDSHRIDKEVAYKMILDEARLQFKELGIEINTETVSNDQ